MAVCARGRCGQRGQAPGREGLVYRGPGGIAGRARVRS